MRRPFLAAVAAIACLGSVPLLAEEELPDRPPSGASFPAAPLSFPAANLNFATAAVAGAAAPADLAGLSVQEEDGRLRFTLGADVLFDFDKARLRSEAEPVLRTLVQEVRERVGAATFAIEGHTDAKGGDGYNQKLSDRRAHSVRDWLVSHGGIAGNAVTMAGYGEARPVAPNQHPDGSDDPEGRQRNRRVEILVTPAG
jgi:outer membrane protein OmpA-like peptidoglycan-associated protein